MGREMKTKYGKFAVHETISEKEKAITPRFKTKEELVNHLVEKGTEYDEPLTKEIAEEFVYRTPWIPSGGIINGKFLKGFEQLEIKLVQKK